MALDLDKLGKVIAGFAKTRFRLVDDGHENEIEAANESDLAERDDAWQSFATFDAGHCAGPVAEILDAAPVLLKMARGAPGTDLFAARQALIRATLAHQSCVDNGQELEDVKREVVAALRQRDAAEFTLRGVSEQRDAARAENERLRAALEMALHDWSDTLDTVPMPSAIKTVDRSAIARCRDVLGASPDARGGGEA